jgi:membrane protein DedA with SNARE-associated domain
LNAGFRNGGWFHGDYEQVPAMSALTELAQSLAMTPWALLLILLVATIDGFFPPIPSESVVIAVAAIVIGLDPWRLAWVWGAGALGAFFGDNIAYLIGRRFDRLWHSKRVELVRRLDQAQQLLIHRGAEIILPGRYVPGVRVAINMAAGLSHYPHRRFIGLVVVNASAWSLMSTLIGSLAGTWFRNHPLVGVGVGIAFGMLLGIILDRIFAARRSVQETRASRSEPTGPDGDRLPDQPASD